ncbi:ABC transporter permease [Halomarina salina]|uniref:ABC transporter permease n=1 Tax=Halomarina salina TaxID=1872699 RepID=A0ABD5RM54_9EURY|nr:ABC transporter permease [Halomarina salina]
MCANSTNEATRGGPFQRDESSLRARIAENPRPAIRWATVAGLLLLVELGAFLGGVLTLLDALVMGITAFFDVLIGLVSPGASQAIVGVQQGLSNAISGFREVAESLPTLLSRQLIPNQGHLAGADGPWVGTFLGLEPAFAWALRVLLVLVYALFAFYWIFQGWLIYRNNYRRANWAPSDDIVNKLRNHRWGQFGILIVLLFLTMALFGSTLSPTTVSQNIQSPYGSEIQFYSEESGQVESITPGDANFNSKSKGAGDQNVAPFSYDQYNRYHPFGTLPNGRDLFTFMMGGARITLIVAGLSIGLSALLAMVFSMLSAYYSGSVDLGILTTADGIVSVPQLLLLIMVSAVFANHWLAGVLDGGFLLALIFAFTGWPGLWRAVRGPALQVAQEEWVDAAKSFGQRPRVIMRKHMFPYVMGYLLVYASMSVGGIIIGLAALSFLGNGLGISPPTPAWGRAISQGQSYVAGPSWHISLIPGLMIVILVTGLNALGDGLRDAIDPETESSTGEQAAAGGGA